MRQSNDNSVITMVVLLAALAVPWSASAQSSSCPLQPTQAKDTDSQLAVDFTNISGKAVASYRFAMTFFDHAGNAHAFPQPLSARVQMVGNTRRTSIWQTQLAKHFLFPYAQAFLQQVTFVDGTSWVDDGSHACSVISVQE